MARVVPGQRCPWCRSGAVTWRPWNSRTQGPFLGCSNFPSCRAAWNEDGSRLGWGWGATPPGGRPLGRSGRSVAALGIVLVLLAVLLVGLVVVGWLLDNAVP
jgi:hypothetical protein